MKRVTRNPRLTPEEASNYKDIRTQIAEEIPDVVERHLERTAAFDELHALLQQLKAAREAEGLDLADLTKPTDK